MVSVSPRRRDDLEFEELENNDPRFALGFRSMSLQTSEYEDHESQFDSRPFSAGPDSSANRRRRRQRRSDTDLLHALPFSYQTLADGDAFRLAVLSPGTGSQPIQCRLLWESSKWARREYKCLSYCWETTHQDAAILCDGYRFPVTKNLLNALRCLREPTKNLLLWVDQICINQADDLERGHQVSIMKNIFDHAKQTIVWLGEGDDRSRKLCEYARKMRRGDDSPKNALNKILPQRQLQDAIQKLLERPWFRRVWVIPEVAFAYFTVVQIGDSDMSWDNLVRLVRDVQLPQSTGFDKKVALLGNPRQRIAIITEMIARHKRGVAHTDVSQLLILAKSSRATDVRDMVYAFYGMTLICTIPDYARPVEHLYVDVAHNYVNNIEGCYASWKQMTDQQRTWQLMSILYSAGSLHQHLELPSWVPDWTYTWHLAPIWCTATSNIVTGPANYDWTEGIRSNFRAGGDKRDNFDFISTPAGALHLSLSAITLDIIVVVGEAPPASTPASNADLSMLAETDPDLLETPSNIRYGRVFFETQNGHIGVATPRIEPGDLVAILLGGDVPVVLRPCQSSNPGARAFNLLCECFVQSHAVMYGDHVRTEWPSAKDVVLV